MYLGSVDEKDSEFAHQTTPTNVSSAARGMPPC